jgi:hypothetical protein
MKKFVILTFAILSCNTCFASVNTQLLDKIEESVFGYTYSEENETSRLNRIEENVYGKISAGNTQSRILKLKKDLAADLMGQEIEPKEDTFAKEEDSWVFEKEPPEAAKMDYPAIDELEKAVYNKDFREQNIKTRLSNLETKTFGKTYENDDLSTRVDRLKAQIRPQNFMSNMIAQQENDFYSGDIGKLDENYHLDAYGIPPFDYNLYKRNQNQYPDYDDMPPSDTHSYIKPSKPLNISSIEKTLYKHKFENETMPTRLARIESSVFGTTFPSDGNSERIARISSAINAQKTAKRYDSNKFSQNMATAFQIGTLILMVLACIL